MRELLFVCCTPGRKEDTVVMRSLSKLGAQQTVFFEKVSVRFASCYNYVLKSLTQNNPIVVFVRDDVLIGDLFIQEKLNQAMDVLGFAVVGVAGGAVFTFDENQPVTAWNQVPPAQLSGAVEYSGVGLQNTWRSYGAAPARCITLDNPLLAVDPKKIGALRFDERFETYFLELDFCLSAHFSGLFLGTTNVYVNRKPETLPADPHFIAAQNMFRAKWRTRMQQQSQKTQSARQALSLEQASPGQQPAQG